MNSVMKMNSLGIALILISDNLILCRAGNRENYLGSVGRQNNKKRSKDKNY